MRNEILKPDNFIEVLTNRLLQLQNVYNLLNQQQKVLPKGHLRIIHNHNKLQYYHVTSSTNGLGKYIKKKDFQIAKNIAQKDYNATVLQVLRKQISALEKIIIKFSENSIPDVYDLLPVTRRDLITPVTLQNDLYKHEWLEAYSEMKAFCDIDTNFYTNNGVHVRSKSEVIIGNMLEKHNIPYIYEIEFEKETAYFVPDFFCLNLRTREAFIWEHFGMLDNPEYANKTAKKLSSYSQYNYYFGKNFIATFETSKEALNTQLVEQLIETNLM